MTDEDIFAHAAELRDPAARADYLASACPDAARRREIEALLDAHDGAGSFLERPAVTAAHAPEAREPREEAGSQIGPYKLLQLLGEGGMGVVWMAEQREPVRRLVAVKVVREGLGSAQVLARFEAERQALALMDHPNIAKVLDADQTAEGRPYFVMELVKGVPITQFCDENKLPVRERLGLFIQVCHAVQHAHSKGVIHRDLKPSNVLVALYDDRPVPKVIDFGIAKAAGEPLTERTLFTAFGTVVGTLEYMSPEQARLNQLDIDTRSDVYSLGVLLYELLTGTTPLERGRLRKAALDEVLRVIREEEPAAPSTRLSASGPALAALSSQRGAQPGQLARLVRGELDWIVLKALEKERDRRYETASGLARDVERHLKDEAVEACPPTVGYRLRKFARKHSLSLALTAALAAVVLGGAALSGWLAVEATRAERRAAEAAELAIADREKALQAGEELGEANRSLRDARGGLEQTRDRLRRALYVSDLKLIQRAWEEDDVGLVGQLLGRQVPKAGEEDLRGFEWYYWASQVDQGKPLARLPGPAGTEVALGAGGARVAWAPLAADRKSATVRVWEVKTGKELFSRPLPPNAVAGPKRGLASVDFRLSPDGRRLAIFTSKDRARSQVGIWDVDTGRLVCDLAEQVWLNGRFVPIGTTFSRDGERLVIGDRVFDCTTGKALYSILPRIFGAMTTAAFSPDNRLLAVWRSGPESTKPSALRILAGHNGGKVLQLSELVGPVWALAFSPDGKRLASVSRAVDTAGHGADRLEVWSVEGGQRLAHTTMPASGGGRLAYSPDGQLLAVLSQGGKRIAVAEASTGRVIHHIKGPKSSYMACAFTPEGKTVVVADGEGALWERGATGSERPLPPGEGRASASSMALSPGGELVARLFAGLGKPTVLQVVDRAGGQRFRATLGERAALRRLTFSPRGEHLSWNSARSSGGRTPGLLVWEAATGRSVLRLDAPVHSVTFSPDGRRLLAAVELGAERFGLRQWELKSAREEAAPPITCPAPFLIQFGPDGQTVFGCGRTAGGPAGVSQVWAWDVAGKRERYRVNLPGAQPDGLSVSPDGKLLALARGVGRSGGAFQVLDARTGEVAFQPERAPVSVAEAVFSPDGRRLVASVNELGRGGNVLVWDVASGQEVLSLNAGAVVRHLTFRADGRQLAACSFDGASLFLWGAAP